MQQALTAAATGMAAEEINMANIANNLANVNTYGFKRARVEFQELLYDLLRSTGTQGLAGNQAPTGMQIGHGVKVSGTQRIFTPGDLRQTNNQYDLAIEGPGFFQIQQQDGQVFYTRDGSFKVDSQGHMVNTDGQYLIPAITIPPNATQISITADGVVTAVMPDNSVPVELGTLQLVNFINPAGLVPQGRNLYAMTLASGQPLVASPGTMGLGKVAQGLIEFSNVSPVDEMVNLIKTQRAYEMGTRILEAADKMLGATSNLR